MRSSSKNTSSTRNNRTPGAQTSTTKRIAASFANHPIEDRNRILEHMEKNAGLLPWLAETPFKVNGNEIERADGRKQILPPPEDRWVHSFPQTGAVLWLDQEGRLIVYRDRMEQHEVSLTEAWTWIRNAEGYFDSYAHGDRYPAFTAMFAHALEQVDGK
jgi:hypothetical protein